MTKSLHPRTACFIEALEMTGRWDRRRGELGGGCPGDVCSRTTGFERLPLHPAQAQSACRRPQRTHLLLNLWKPWSLLSLASWSGHRKHHPLASCNLPWAGVGVYCKSNTPTRKWYFKRNNLCTHRYLFNFELCGIYSLKHQFRIWR